MDERVCRKNDVSHGIILMVDMGSLREIYRSFEENLKSPLVVMNNISTQMAIMAGELIQKEEKLEDIVRILEEENETEYKIIYPQIQNKNYFNLLHYRHRNGGADSSVD